MSEAIEYEQFEQPGAPTPAGEADLSRLADIPMQLSVEIGRTHTTVGETLELQIGSIVELDREAGAPADLLVNGTPIARGEVVVVDERYGLRITDIIDAPEPLDGSAAALAGSSEDGDAAEPALAAEAPPEG